MKLVNKSDISVQSINIIVDKKFNKSNLSFDSRQIFTNTNDQTENPPPVLWSRFILARLRLQLVKMAAPAPAPAPAPDLAL